MQGFGGGQRANGNRGRGRGGANFRGRSGAGRGGYAGGRGEQGEKPSYYLCRNHFRGTCRNGTCSFDHSISCHNEISAHAKPIKAITFMGDGSALITGSLDKTIKMWNMAVSPPEPRSIDVDGEVQHLSIVGSCLMWANSVLPAPAPVPSDAVGVVELLDIATGSRAKCLRAESMPYTHPMPVVCFSSAVIGDCLFIFTAGGEGIIRAWQYNKSANTFSQVSLFEGHTRGITALLFIGGNLWSGSMDRSLRCWTLTSSECVGTITSANDGHTEPVTSLETIHAEGQDFVVSGGADSMLKVWNLAGGNCSSDNQGSIITALKTSSDSLGHQLLLVGLLDGRINIRSGASLNLLCRLDSHILCHTGAVWALENCGSGYFASGGEDGKLILWKIDGNLTDKS